MDFPAGIRKPLGIHGQQVWRAFPYFGELLVVALTPAICEEALHRGLLQYSLRGIKEMR